MVDSRVYVFNQYYLDLLKRVKNSAKKFKEKSKSAKNVLTSVKSNYSTFDKTEITKETICNVCKNQTHSKRLNRVSKSFAIKL